MADLFAQSTTWIPGLSHRKGEHAKTNEEARWLYEHENSLQANRLYNNWMKQYADQFSGNLPDVSSIARTEREQGGRAVGAARSQARRTADRTAAQYGLGGSGAHFAALENIDAQHMNQKRMLEENVSIRAAERMYDQALQNRAMFMNMLMNEPGMADNNALWYQQFKARNAASDGGSPWGAIGTIAGAALGSFGGPMGMMAGASLGGAIGGAAGGGGM